MNDDERHPVIRIIRRVRLRKDLKPISFLARPNSQEVDWLAIAHSTDDTAFESFDLVFFRPDGAAFPWMGFETLKIARDQAHAMIGVEYVEWEPCNVQITDADRSVHWERALPGAEEAACS